MYLVSTEKKTSMKNLTHHRWPAAALRPRGPWGDFVRQTPVLLHRSRWAKQRPLCHIETCRKEIERNISRWNHTFMIIFYVTCINLQLLLQTKPVTLSEECIPSTSVACSAAARRFFSQSHIFLTNSLHITLLSAIWLGQSRGIFVASRMTPKVLDSSCFVYIIVISWQHCNNRRPSHFFIISVSNNRGFSPQNGWWK